VFLYDDITILIQDEDSISANGIFEQNFNFKYLTDYSTAMLLAYDLVRYTHEPRTEVEAIYYHVNRSVQWWMLSELGARAADSIHGRPNKH